MSQEQSSSIALNRLLVLACLLTLGSLAAGFHWQRTPHRPSGGAMRIDPNQANWWDLTLIPDVGPTLAREIVAYRDQKQAQRKTEVAFQRLEDLDAVKGIGPKRLQRMAPYFVFKEKSGSDQAPGSVGH